MRVKRGDIVLVEHPFSAGAGSKVRPVLVVQCDRDNARMTSTIVAVITRTIHRAGQVDTQYLIDIATPEGKASGIRSTSVVNCSNLFTVDERLLGKIIGTLPPFAMQRIDACLKAALQIA